MPNYEDPCAVTPVTTNVDKPACRCSQEIRCKKKKSKKIKKLDKSRTQKGDLGKNERLGGLKTQKGGPGKIRDMNKMIILIGRKPARALYAKVKDQTTK